MRPDDGRMVPTFVRQALAGEPLTVAGDGRQTRSICYVDDTVRGILALAASDLADGLRRTIAWFRTEMGAPEVPS